jgi:hypothetical protein
VTMDVETKQRLTCCWLSPDNEESGCDSLATYEVWEREDDGRTKYEGDTLCCDAHVRWAMPTPGVNGVLVYALPVPGVRGG